LKCIKIIIISKEKVKKLNDYYIQFKKAKLKRLIKNISKKRNDLSIIYAEYVCYATDFIL